jgi:hypothetical protein
MEDPHAAPEGSDLKVCRCHLRGLPPPPLSRGVKRAWNEV